MDELELKNLLKEEMDVHTMLCATCGEIFKTKEGLKRLESLKVDLQKQLTSLGIRKKELLGEIHIIPSKTSTLKIKVRASAIPQSVRKKFSSLSPEDKASIVAEMLEGLR